MGFHISNRGGNRQLNFSAGSRFAPETQLRPDVLRAFAEPGQPPVSGAPSLLQDFRVNTFSIVAYTQAKLMIIVPDFGFDPACLCMLKRVP